MPRLLGCAGCLVALTACFDFDQEPRSSGGSAPTASVGEGAGGTSTGGETTGTSANGSTAVSTSSGTSTSSSGGGGGAASSGAGGEGAGCPIPGAGDPGDVGPFSFSLGPVRSGGGPVASMGAALEGERLVVVSTSYPDPDGPTPVSFNGAIVTDGASPAYLLAWIDDGGTEGFARRLQTDAPPLGALTANVSVAAGRPGKVVIALSHLSELADGGGVVTLVEYDLCTDEETVLARCTGAGIQVANVDADASGRIAVSFQSNHSEIVCDPIPGGCVVPPLAGSQDSFVWQVRPDGTCQSGAIVNPDEANGVVSVQSRVEPVLAPDGGLLLIGSYDGFLFEGPAAIGTAETPLYFYPSSLDADAFHDFVARTDPQDGLVPTDARDLGRAGNGGRHVVPFDGGFVVATTVQTNVEPTSEFEPPLSLPDFPGSSHLLLAALDANGATLWGGWTGSVGEDAVDALSRNASGMILSGNSTHFGGCTDNSNEARCAMFVRLYDDGGLGPPFLVDADEANRTDVGVGAFALPGDDAWIVGASAGTVVLDRALPTPTAQTSMIYAARVALGP